MKHQICATMKEKKKKRMTAMNFNRQPDIMITVKYEEKEQVITKNADQFYYGQG